jgi:signal transduction histidine kinase
MSGIAAHPEKPAAIRAPRVVLWLDETARILNVDRSLAGTSFPQLSKRCNGSLHGRLHSDCDGDCEFSNTWRTAWMTLEIRDSVEWEIDDPITGLVLRLHLSRPLAPRSVQHNRRRERMLAITDITRHRRKYENLVASRQELINLLADQQAHLNGASHSANDHQGDSGVRLIAGPDEQHRIRGRRLILAQEDERKRIAADLHDGIAPTIGSIKLKLETCLAYLEGNHSGIDRSHLENCVDELKDLVNEIRRISCNLAPSMLENFGLHVAVDWLCENFAADHSGVDIDCKVHIDESSMSDILKIAIYRVVQEALTNAGEHASPQKVNVNLESNSLGLRLCVVDDGAGFDPGHLHGDKFWRRGLGLDGMRERVEATGGSFELKSAPGQGVTIEAYWLASEMELIRS